MSVLMKPFLEIARLQNSLIHLKRTQTELQEHVDSSPDKDADILEALEENKETMYVESSCSSL